MKKTIIIGNLLFLAISLFLSAYLCSADWKKGQELRESVARQELLQIADVMPEQLQEFTAFAERLGQQDDMIAVFTLGGERLAQSKPESDYRMGEEFSQAVNTGYGFSIHQNERDGLSYDCAALKAGKAGQDIVLCLVKPSVKQAYLSEQIIVAFAVGVCAQAIISLMIYRYFRRHISHPLNRLNAAVDEVASGRYGKEISIEEQQGEPAELAQSFNVMNRILADKVNEMGEQNGRLYAMLDSLNEAVIAVDMHSRILLTNHAAHTMMGIPSNCTGMMLLETVHSEALGRLLDQARGSNGSATEELRLRMDSSQLLRVQISPIKSESASFMGEMIVAEDVTQMRQLEKMRSEFASNVSHELKTPLTSIIGFVDTLKGGALENHKVAERFIDIIGKESDRLYRLIQDILTLSSIEKSSADMQMQWVDLREIAARVVDLLQDMAQKKGLAFSFDVASDLPNFFCNRDRIFQMFLNLCDNAVKYTEQGSVCASLNFDIEQEELCFSVRDTGIGIPKEMCERIFERFYRVDKGRSRDMGGTGLGLSIVKHIVLLYGGTISVESRVGRGSVFYVRLPYTRS